MSSRSPFARALAKFLDYLGDQRRMSPRTLVAYRGDLDQFERYLEEEHGADQAPAPEKIDTLPTLMPCPVLSR